MYAYINPDEDGEPKDRLFFVVNSNTEKAEQVQRNMCGCVWVCGRCCLACVYVCAVVFFCVGLRVSAVRGR